MTREDLFAAIGQVEEYRLARCENTAPSGIVRLEGDEVKNKTGKRPLGRTLRNVLVAAAVLALLAVSVVASWDAEDAFDQYQLYEDPQSVLEAAFGENGTAYYEGSVTTQPNEIHPTYEDSFERIPVDPDLAKKYLEPYLYAVNESWELKTVSKLDGFENITRLTVEANLFDAGTGCGVLYYVLEDNVGIDYQVCYDGSITGGDVRISPHGKEYLDTAKTTQNKLCVAVRYIALRNQDHAEVMCVGGEGISVPLVKRELQHITIGNGKVTISPIGMRVEDSTAVGCENMDCIDEVIICFADGTEYTLFGALEGKDYGMNNLAYALGPGENNKKVVYAFNRVVDVEQITAVVINGIEHPVD